MAIVHLVLACLYASATPYRTPGVVLGQGRIQVSDIGAPDERQHANYVLSLLQGKGFPVLDPKDPNLRENYQAHQPPLFYVLEAAWVKVTGTNLESPSDGLKARMLNTLIGAGTVMGAFFLGLWAFRREDVGLVAAAFVALLPMNTALSGAISNDPLLYCLCTWTLAFIARGCVEGWTFKIALIVGLFTGLAIITKTTAVALLPILLLALFLGPNKPSVKQIGVCAAALLLVAAPWLIRNQGKYGDPLAISAFNQAFTGSPTPAIVTFSYLLDNDAELAKKVDAYAGEHPDLQGLELVRAADRDIGLGATKSMHYWRDWVGWWTVRSFFGVFGYMDIFLNESGVPTTDKENPNLLYRLLLIVASLLAVAWLLALKKPEWAEHKKMHLLMGAFLAIVFLLFLRFNAQYFQGQARYLFPAIAVFGMGFAIALLNVCKNRWQVALAAMALLFGGLNLYALSKLPEEFKRRVTVTMRDQTVPAGSHVLFGNTQGSPRV